VNQWDDDNLDGEGPLESDLEELGDDGEPQTAPCPLCGVEIYDDSVQCPACKQYIFPTAGTRHRWPWWWALAAAVALIAFVCYILV
jgi:hypothetical protein